MVHDIAKIDIIRSDVLKFRRAVFIQLLVDDILLDIISTVKDDRHFKKTADCHIFRGIRSFQQAFRYVGD